MQTNVKVQNYNAKVRKFSSAREAALSSDFIPESVYDSLVSAVNKHLPLLQRYIALRAKILGISDLKMYDMYTPLSETDYKFTYEEALAKSEEGRPHGQRHHPGDLPAHAAQLGIASGDLLDLDTPLTRSEERRVGKECRSRWSPYH